LLSATEILESSARVKFSINDLFRVSYVPTRAALARMRLMNLPNSVSGPSVARSAEIRALRL
jgi:hypothetical protein